MTSPEETRAAQETRIESAQRYLLRCVKDKSQGHQLHTLTERANTWWSSDIVSEAFMRLLVEHSVNLDSMRIVHLTITGDLKLEQMMKGHEEEKSRGSRASFKEDILPALMTDEQHKALLEAEIQVQSKRAEEANSKKFTAQEELRKLNQKLNYNKHLRQHINTARNAVIQSNLNGPNKTSLHEVIAAAEAYLCDRQAKHG